MQIKTPQVHAALAQCMDWYAGRGQDIRLLSERTEELWLQIDDWIEALQEAELNEDLAAAKHCLHALIRCVSAIQAEVLWLSARTN